MRYNKYYKFKWYYRKVNIENSFSDALDVDFSNVSFNKIKISNAINDCVDFLMEIIF